MSLAQGQIKHARLLVRGPGQSFTRSPARGFEGGGSAPRRPVRKSTSSYPELMALYEEFGSLEVCTTAQINDLSISELSRCPLVHQESQRHRHGMPKMIKQDVG